MLKGIDLRALHAIRQKKLGETLDEREIER
jgi:hypothetical protein